MRRKSSGGDRCVGRGNDPSSVYVGLPGRRRVWKRGQVYGLCPSLKMTTGLAHCAGNRRAHYMMRNTLMRLKQEDGEVEIRLGSWWSKGRD